MTYGKLLACAFAAIGLVSSPRQASAIDRLTDDEVKKLFDTIENDRSAFEGALDDKQWRTGRGAVLRRLLDRQPMYNTEAGRSRWERRARANMAAELASLEPREHPGP